MKIFYFESLKNKLIIFICLACVMNTRYVVGQPWVRTFYQTTNTYFHEMTETYDKGYFIVGQVNSGPGVPKNYTWLNKTDINGYLIWAKTLCSPTYQIVILGIDKVEDGGIILTGVTTKVDSTGYYDILFIKINSCGEKVWCKIISTPGNDDYGIRIKYVNNGFVALIRGYEDFH